MFSYISDVLDFILKVVVYEGIDNVDNFLNKLCIFQNNNSELLGLFSCDL